MALFLRKVGVLMEFIAGALVLYLIEPFGSLVFILLTGFAMYDPDYFYHVIVALVVLAIARRQMK